MLKKCEPSSAYAAALAIWYRSAMNYIGARHLSGIIIMEHYGECKKINIVDAFTFIIESFRISM